MAGKSKYKASTAIYSRVTADFKAEFKDALDAIGFTESNFLRTMAEALIHQMRAGNDLALPLRIRTVEDKAKKARRPA